MSFVIQSIKAREILDSRGNPTVEVSLETNSGKFISSVPSGASTGRHEAVELRDGGKRYHGKGVLKAVNNVNSIIWPEIKKRKPLFQEELDQLMINLDGTKNKSKLGSNAILGVSMAFCRAIAFEKKKPLYKHISEISKFSLSIPRAAFNVINGGAHAGNNLDFQEFMIVPNKKSFADNLQEASEIYHNLKKEIEKKYSSLAINVGDEGGFAPPINNPEEALKIIMKIKKIDIILDVAATEFFNGKEYETSFKKKNLFNYYLKIINKYPILAIEDPFAEDDWEKWNLITQKIGHKISLIGDDLLVTNPERITRAVNQNSCNAMILKLNQIGTITEGIKAAMIAKNFGWKIMVSHRSGETTDDFIADFAVGISADYIKSGAPARGERIVKYNRILKIEKELNNL